MSNDKQDELKACPWCQAKPEIETGIDSEGFGEFYIDHVCDGEYGTVSITITDSNKNTLKLIWNTRQEDAEVKKLRVILEEVGNILYIDTNGIGDLDEARRIIQEAIKEGN